jgi:hypothetical protein
MVQAWRTAFEQATAGGPAYFAWASDHDRWDPRWLETLVGELDGHPALVLAYPLTQRVDPLGSPLTKPARQFETAGITGCKARWKLLTHSDSVAAGDIVYGLMRTDAVRQAGVFRDVLCPDRLLIAELTLQGQIRQVPDVLWFRRQFAAGSIERQRSTLFAPGTKPPSRFTPPWWMHTRSLWATYGRASRTHIDVPPATIARLIVQYSAAYACRHYARASVQRGLLAVLGWPRWIYKRVKHAVLLGVYGALVTLRQVGITPRIERLCERITGRPGRSACGPPRQHWPSRRKATRHWRGHA